MSAVPEPPFTHALRRRVKSLVPPAMRRWWRARHPAATDVGAPSVESGPRVAFQCNLCGTRNDVASREISREIPSCTHCGSTVRSRALVHLACESLLGAEIVATQARRRPDIAGLGMSDAACVADAFGRVFDYTNTFFHTDPRLDITAIPDELASRYDFVTSSDVFEHVVPPVAIAFVNARRLLKPGGVFVLTVPFSLEADTVEHFPELHDWRLEETAGRWRLHNVTRDGRVQTFDELVFHGGPGTTLEMRLFSRAALERHLEAAGFREWHLSTAPCPRFGIAWPEPWSVPIVARA